MNGKTRTPVEEETITKQPRIIIQVVVLVLLALLLVPCVLWPGDGGGAAAAAACAYSGCSLPSSLLLLLLLALSLSYCRHILLRAGTASIGKSAASACAWVSRSFASFAAG